MKLNDENLAKLAGLGFQLGERAPGGVTQGAWFATDSHDMPVVLKWTPDQTIAERYETLIPSLDKLRAGGVPVPAYSLITEFDGGILSAQQALPGKPEDNPPPSAIEDMTKYISAQAGLDGPPPTAEQENWGEYVVHSLCVGGDELCTHEPLRQFSKETAAILDKIQAAGNASLPKAFPNNGLVHLDLHTDNVLIDEGRVSGIIDWEGACAGDHNYDLVQFAFDLDGHDQPVWNIVDDAQLEPHILRAYVALLVLKCTSSAIINNPGDVHRQLARAERVFKRYDV